MNILILSDTSKYSYHKNAIADLENVIFSCQKDNDRNSQVGIIDLSDNSPMNIHFRKVKSFNSDLIINLDFSGFIFRTEGESISLNDLHSRIVNIMFQKPEYYTDELSFRQNLSMFTYFPSRIVAAENDLKILIDKYPNIPNIRIMCEYDYKAISDNDKEINLYNLRKWIGEMFEDVMKLHRFRGKICIY